MMSNIRQGQTDQARTKDSAGLREKPKVKSSQQTAETITTTTATTG